MAVGRSIICKAELYKIKMIHFSNENNRPEQIQKVNGETHHRRIFCGTGIVYFFSNFQSSYIHTHTYTYPPPTHNSFYFMGIEDNGKSFQLLSRQFEMNLVGWKSCGKMISFHTDNFSHYIIRYYPHHARLHCHHHHHHQQQQQNIELPIYDKITCRKPRQKRIVYCNSISS